MGIMKLLQLICLFCVWWTDYVSGYHDYHQSPYTGNCGVQLTRAKTGGVYYAYPGTTPISYGTGNSGAASTQHSSVSSSLYGNNNGYYGSYGNSGNYGSGSGRYPSTSTGSQYGNGYNNNYQGASSSSNAGKYAGASGGYSTGNYGGSSLSSSSSAQKNSYGSSGSGSQSSGSSNYGYSGNSGLSSSSSGNYGSGSGWSQTQQNAYEDEQVTSSSSLVFAKDVLTAHNSYRARHSTPPVTLDTTMSLKAQEWANELASGRSSYGHSPEAVEGIYGESLLVLNNKYPSGISLMDDWYDEMDNYDYKHPAIVRRPRNKRNSHFTAMMWYATKKIGVGKATSPDGKSYVVVSYYPPGNNVDVLENNVFAPKN